MHTRATVVIPKDRIGVLIGPEGSMKNDLERRFSVSLKIDSEGGAVEVLPASEASDALMLLKAREAVKAIGRGFPPEKAFLLIDDDNAIEIIDLRELFGKNEADIRRIKGRVIGRDGKIRRLIEEISKCSLSIYGHTISILGDLESVSMAREAVEMLVAGKQHATVYGFLRRKRSELKKKKTLEIWEKPVG